jgi:hypothetical protein
MAYRETLEQLVARVNANAFIPGPNSGERIMAREFKLPKGAKLVKKVIGQSAKYPWEEWFAVEDGTGKLGKDKQGNPLHEKGQGKLLIIERSSGKENDKGTVVEVTEKRDYEVPRDAMPPKIKTAARRRYKVVDVYKRDHTNTTLPNGGLLIQARDMTAEEKVAEDILRAEEKAKRAETEGGGDDEEVDLGADPSAVPEAVSA